MDKYIGKKLNGRYDVMEIIGVGGMAVVYKAKDLSDGRIVAIKILKDEYVDNEEFRRRFKNECKAIAVLSHPNIIKVYDVSFGDRVEYIVMEHVDGITLKEYIEQQKIVRWKEAVHFTVQILRALQHAHDKGIVHRDIKPQNIMLLQDGTIKVTDFGIARFSRTETRTINSQKAIGSVHYISPEQARGEITDEKTDIYSVGVMLYEMLTGRLPFEADSAVSVAIMQLQSEPRPPRELNDSIPEGLEEITLHAMQKKADQRYQSAAEMLRDIDEFKRNPSIHFEYKYFVDETPTKLVDSINRVKQSPSDPVKGAVHSVEEEEHKKTLTLPVLGGIALAVVLFAGIIFGLITWLGGVFNPGSGNLIDAPPLVGMKLDEAVEEYPNITIEKVASKYSTEYDKDYIIEQDPAVGSKIEGNSVVQVTVSLGKNVVRVPNVYGQTAESAKAVLISAGFIVKEVPVESDSVLADYVVLTKPERNTEAAKGDTIEIHVSTGNAGATFVPTGIIGVSLQNAELMLNSKGLKVGEVKNVNSNRPSGEVLECSPGVGSKVYKGSAVHLTISNGQQATSDVSVSVDLPYTSTKVSLKVYINGKAEDRLSVSGLNPASQRSHSFTIRGTDKATVVVQISADGQNNYSNYAKYAVDFATGKATLTEKYQFNEPTSSSLPPSSSSTPSSAAPPPVSSSSSSSTLYSTSRQEEEGR